MVEEPGNLVDQAKQLASKGRRVGRGPGEVDLALAWLRGEVTLSSVYQVLHAASSGSVYSMLATGLRAAYQAGRLIERPVSEIEVLRGRLDGDR